MQIATDVAPDDSPVFNSKIDIGLMYIIGMSLLTPFVGGAMGLWRGGGNARDGLMMIGIVALITLLLLVLVVPLIYQVTATHLLVRCGVMKRDIALSSIQSICPTHNLLAAPALSLDRLRIDYIRDGSRQTLLISPDDKAAFLSAIASRAPELQLRYDGWQR